MSIKRVLIVFTFGILLVPLIGSGDKNIVSTFTSLTTSNIEKIEVSSPKDQLTKSLNSDETLFFVKLLKKMNGKIVIKITERKPIALVNMKSIYYIDKNGILFPIAKKVISDMPVFCGLRDTIDNKGLHRISSSDMLRVRNFMNNITDLDEDFCQNITQIDFSEKEKIRLSFQAFSTIVEMDQNNITNGLSNLIRLEELLHKSAVVPEKINLCYQNIAFVTVNESMEQKEPVQRIAD
jgi:cell division septal protein FtsQ